MLRLLGGGVEDALAAVDLHAHVQLKVDVALGGGAAEAAAGWCAGPALAEQLTHCGEAGRLPVGQLTGGRKKTEEEGGERQGAGHGEGRRRPRGGAGS